MTGYLYQQLAIGFMTAHEPHLSRESVCTGLFITASKSTTKHITSLTNIL